MDQRVGNVRKKKGDKGKEKGKKGRVGVRKWVK